MLTPKEVSDVVPIPAVTGPLNIWNGSMIAYRAWKAVDGNVYQFTIGLLIAIMGAWSIYLAFTGRMPMKKDKNTTVGNDDSQPSSNEVTHKDNNTSLEGIVIV